MQAMQYEITLPADYDMRIIRHRVRTRGGALDAFPGLGLKAYLIREQDAGSPVNQYAPFYLWHHASGMNRFLWGGGGFQGIVADFGRPAVRQWTGAGFQAGPAWTAVPRAAVRRTVALPREADPTALVERELADLWRHADSPGVHSTALAVNPYHWELVRLTLHEEAPPPADTAATAGEERVPYEVLYVNSPELDRLPTGRHW